jgi:hypothetical protein
MTEMHGTKDWKYLCKQRQIFKTEMMKALSCRTKRSKIKLVDDWKKHYSEQIVKELILLARNHSARLKVAYWDLPNFETQKLSKHQ